nr:3673_t:CDS:10 [Entrophospora candida]
MSNDSELRFRFGSENNSISNNTSGINDDDDDNRIFDELNDNKKEKVEGIVYGKTPYNSAFPVPRTVEMLTSVFDPKCAYNMGLGWLLKYQSDKRGLVIWAKRNNIFHKKNLKWYPLLKKELSTKMGDDYDFDDSGFFINLLRWIGGFFLLWFNIWVKVDAHRVVKDFAWYWGDFFFLIDQSLTFDGVFEMAPHPMYSVGYVGYYGISMITSSYTVLFVSLAAHAAQFAFLTIVENPPGTPDNIVKTFLVLQCLTWRIFHSYGLGYMLYLQSKSKFLTKHYVKFGGNVNEAFSNWKSIYNLSLCMTYVTFIVAAWKMYYFPVDWTYGLVLLRHTMGVLLIALHIWTSVSVFEVLGDFGWFYGDFFMDDYSTTLYYTGIYRFVNNPEKIMGHAAFWGITLIANSWLIFGMALFSQISSFLFLRYVEGPHMKKLYGDKVRKEAGITKTIKRLKIIPATVRKEMSKIRETTEIQVIQKVIKELAETVERAVEETADALGEFVESTKPKLQEVVEEAKTMLQNSRVKLISQAVGRIQNHDVSRYSIVLVAPEDSTDITPSSTPISSREQFKTISKPIIFTLGSPIRLKWTAPNNHSHKDWIGVYKVTSNSSKNITSVTSRGRYMYVLPEDEDFDNNNAAATPTTTTATNVTSELWFKGDQLPWEVGTYEFRYHHDNKHIVMAISQPFEIKAPTPKYILDLPSVEQMVLTLVQKALDTDPKFVPYSTQDDYVLMKEVHAKRIVYGIKMSFGVDFAWEVVAIDGNVRRLARRIHKARLVLSPIQGKQQINESDIEKSLYSPTLSENSE